MVWSVLILALICVIFVFVLVKIRERNGSKALFIICLIMFIGSIADYLRYSAYLFANGSNAKWVSVGIPVVAIVCGVLLRMRANTIRRKEEEEKERQEQERQEQEKARQEQIEKKYERIDDILRKRKRLIDRFSAQTERLCSTLEETRQKVTMLSILRPKYVRIWDERYTVLSESLKNIEKECQDEVYPFYVIDPVPGGPYDPFDMDRLERIMNPSPEALPGKEMYHKFKELYEELHGESVGITAGEKGEALVEDTIAYYKDRYTYVKNIVLKDSFAEDATAEIDLVIITAKAVFVAEIKNRGEGKSWELEISKDGQWICHKGRHVETWPSTAEQNIRHKIVLEESLKKAFSVDSLKVPIIPVIVIANNDMTIKNHSAALIYRRSELVSMIEMYDAEPVLSKNEIQEIKTVLTRQDISDQKIVTVTNYEALYPVMQEYVNLGWALYQDIMDLNSVDS